MEKMYYVTNQTGTFEVWLFGKDPDEVVTYVSNRYNRRDGLKATEALSTNGQRPIVNLWDVPSGSFFRPCHSDEDIGEGFLESNVVIQKIRQSYDLPVVQVLQFSKYRLRQLKKLRDLWWVQLPEWDRENYYATTGTIGFLEEHLPKSFYNSLTESEITDILDYICY